MLQNHVDEMMVPWKQGGRQVVYRVPLPVLGLVGDTAQVDRLDGVGTPCLAVVQESDELGLREGNTKLWSVFEPLQMGLKHETFDTSVELVRAICW
jgi:hypothetical protein